MHDDGSAVVKSGSDRDSEAKSEGPLMGSNQVHLRDKDADISVTSVGGSESNHMHDVCIEGIPMELRVVDANALLPTMNIGKRNHHADTGSGALRVEQRAENRGLI
ncbi:hypothetical protein GN244_ATG00137 [Phytophthora infestans]|uniref:Uncharacterized protein n=1 Tax=Phytophthora infestans TaxID=4787 RepID=A0A833T4N8_PHYIN|nr:hypothetical protein GN244_ATG00137 [Phytophthora infestans]